MFHREINTREEFEIRDVSIRQYAYVICMLPTRVERGLAGVNVFRCRMMAKIEDPQIHILRVLSTCTISIYSTHEYFR